MSRTCELCGAPAHTEISAKVAPDWGATCELVQVFACEQHFDAVWARVDQDYTLSHPHLVAEKRRRHRIMAAGFDF